MSISFIPLLSAFNLFTPILCFAFVITISCSVLSYFVLSCNKNGLNFAERIFLFLAFALFGSTIGAIMGAGKATDISAFITSIITFASGYLAYLINKDSDKNLKKLIPLSFVIFLVNILVSLFYMRFFFNPLTTNTLSMLT